MDTVPVSTSPKCKPVSWQIVDLDQTLVRADLFVERLVRLFLIKPWVIVPFIVRGNWSIPALKQFVARKSPLSTANLPYDQNILRWINKARSEGKKTVLATAADQQDANKVAEHLGGFDVVLASDGIRNLKGKTKLKAIHKLTCGESFNYAGDSVCDLAIMKEATNPILVGGSRRLRARFSQTCPDGEIIESQNNGKIWALIKALRPHQWAKNILIFVPAVTSANLYEPSKALLLLPAFLLFCLCASFGYIINDIADVDADRAHPHKLSRPFASGTLSIRQGLFLLFTLAVLAVIIGFLFLSEYWMIYVVYLSITWAYSFRLKEVPIIDVFILSFFYVFRVVAGAEVLEVDYSSWFVIFLALTFFSLAWLKRYIEICDSGDNICQRRRGYRRQDEIIVLGCGLACAFCGVLVLFLYTESEVVTSVYKSPKFLLFLGIPYLYMLLDLWRKAVGGLLHHDPVRHVLLSPSAYLSGIVFVGILFAGRYF